MPPSRLERFVVRSLLVLMAVMLLSGPAFAKKKAKDSETAVEIYEKGLRHMRRGYFTKALEEFNRVRNYHRDDPASVKAQLAIAEVHYKKGDFEQARFAFEEFSAYHPRHPDLDYVTYMIGMSIYRRAAKFAGRDQTATRGAVNMWTGFDSRFPESEHVEEVEKLRDRGRDRLAEKEVFVARFYARRDAWGAVRHRAEYLMRRYHDSPHAATGLLLLGTAFHSWGLVDEAVSVRGRLESEFPESRELKKLVRTLSGPAGEAPEEAIYRRPYRIRGLASPSARPG